MKTKSELIRTWRFWVACLGAIHFGVSSLLWIVFSVFTLSMAKKATGDITGEGVFYIAVRFVPCLILLVGFLCALHAQQVDSHRATPILLASMVCGFLLFAYDLYTHNYQVQEMTDNGCVHTYVTWFWLNDAWSPWR